MPLRATDFSEAWEWHWFDFAHTFTHFYLLTSNLLPNFLISVTHSFFNIILSVITLNKIVGIDLQNKVDFKS